MMMKFLVVALSLLLLTMPVEAATLDIELAQDAVDITTGFNGAKVVLFGITDTPGADIAITLKGPDKTVIVRKKGRVGGAWMNTDSVEFRRVPSYYDFAATKPAATIAPQNILSAQYIGVDHLGFYSEDASDDAQKVDFFADSLLADMQGRGFYPLSSKTIRFMEPTFFKVDFDLPPGVPTGIYAVHGALIQDGAVIAEDHRTFQVGQVGFNARVYLFATENAFLYGVFSIVIAVLSGWSAFTFLRRD